MQRKEANVTDEDDITEIFQVKECRDNEEIAFDENGEFSIMFVQRSTTGRSSEGIRRTTTLTETAPETAWHLHHASD